MTEEIEAAQQAIQQILTSLNIKTIVCVDDIYALNDNNVEVAIGWLTRAKLEGKTEECNKLLDGLPLDASDDEVWKRALRARWGEFSENRRGTIFDELATILNYSEDIERDLGSASLLQGLIPQGVSLVELGPAEWEQDRDSILANEQGLLCLFDHNLQYADYSEEHGIVLLDKTVDAGRSQPVICGLLTHMVEEGDEIGRGDQLADQIGRKRKDFLVLSKDRLSAPIKFAHGLKMMSLNFARDFLTSQVQDITAEASRQANEKLMEVDIYDFDYMVLRSSENEGLWEAETLFRLFEIFRRAVFRQSAFSPDNRNVLDERIAHIRDIREVKTGVDEENYPRDQRWEIRRLELYETQDFINEGHLPLELGDIFEIGKRKLILVTQPCDLMVRRDGRRSAETLTLVNITGISSSASFILDYFDSRTGEKSYAKFRSSYHVSADILDLTVFNSDGRCRFDPSASAPYLLHVPWLNRFNEIRKKFRQYQRQFVEIHKEFENSNLSKSAKAYLQKSLIGRMTKSNLDIPLGYENGVFEFGLQRIARYRHPGAGRLLSGYFSFLSRYAEEHDYTGPERIADGVWRCPDYYESAKAKYVGAEASNSFHISMCQHSRQISQENRICFESRDAAINFGREPCGICKP